MSQIIVRTLLSKWLEATFVSMALAFPSTFTFVLYSNVQNLNLS